MLNVIVIIGFLVFFFVFGYGIFYFICKVVKKEKCFLKKLFCFFFIGGFILFLIGGFLVELDIVVVKVEEKYSIFDMVN